MSKTSGRYVNVSRPALQRSTTCRIEECNLESLPGLDELPLCGHHAAKALRVLTAALHGSSLDALDALAASSSDDLVTPVVYYVDFGDWIKIGTTTRMNARMAAFRNSHPNPVLLATEPGGRGWERRRQEQFSDCHLGREMFRKDARLMAHIAKLARAAA